MSIDYLFATQIIFITITTTFRLLVPKESPFRLEVFGTDWLARGFNDSVFISALETAFINPDTVPSRIVSHISSP